MNCRHCANADTIRSHEKADANLMLKRIEEAADANILHVYFLGGEPFLYMDDLKLYCEKAHELGLKPAIVTNAYWAKSKAHALTVLKSLKGLSTLMISTDFYHLEFVDSSIVKNAIDACVELKLNVIITAVCTQKGDKDRLAEVYKDYKKKIYINVNPCFTTGNAKNIYIDRFVLENEADKLSRHCNLNSYHVEMDGTVFACCNTVAMRVGCLQNEKLVDMIQNIEKTPMFKFMAEKGTKGLVMLLQDSPYYKEFKHREYTCDCDFCMDVFNDKECSNYIIELICSGSAAT